MSLKTCIVFIVGNSANRDGLPEDIDKITKTFKGLFKAEIYDWTDLDKEKLKTNLKSFSEPEWRKKFEAIHFVTTFCLAHGREEGEVVFPDCIKSVRKLLLPPLIQLKELDKKLKWIIVQTCRGKMNGPPMQRDGKKAYYPDYFFMSYCTGEGTISWQEGNAGKVFIKSICDELTENAHQLSLYEIQLRANAKVEEYGKSLQLMEMKPMPDMNTNLGEEFYFYLDNGAKEE